MFVLVGEMLWLNEAFCLLDVKDESLIETKDTDSESEYVLNGYEEERAWR